MNFELITKEYNRLILKKNPTNANKLKLIFEFWVFNFEIALNYKFNFPENCMDLYTAINEQEDPSFAKAVKRRSKKLYSKFFFYFIKWIPLNHGVVEGGGINFFSRIKRDITLSKINSLEWSVDLNFKNEFVLSIKKHFENKALKLFMHTLPDVFFCKTIKNRRLPKIYTGSVQFFLKSDFCKILFYDRYIKFFGIAHGGNYGEILNNVIEKFELKVSDKFFYWGTGNNNIQQNRFPILPLKSRNVNKLIWIGKCPPNLFTRKYFNTHELIFNESNSIFLKNYFNIINLCPLTFLKHPRTSKVDKKISCIKSFSNLKQYEIESSLFVIDSPGSTFLYRAIYQNIPFILIYKKSWFQHLSPKFLKFLKFLESKSLILYWEDESFVLNYFKKIKSGIHYPASLFESCRNWLEDN